MSELFVLLSYRTMAGSEASLANGTAMNGGGELVAVGKVVNSLPAPDFAGLTIESQTNAIGLIHPPPDIRAIVDKTAQFVAKNGTDAVCSFRVTFSNAFVVHKRNAEHLSIEFRAPPREHHSSTDIQINISGVVRTHYLSCPGLTPLYI